MDAGGESAGTIKARFEVRSRVRWLSLPHAVSPDRKTEGRGHDTAVGPGEPINAAGPLRRRAWTNRRRRPGTGTARLGSGMVRHSARSCRIPRAASRALGARTELAGGRTQLGASATNGHGGHLRGHTASMIMAASPACSDALERSDGVCGSDCVFFPLLSLSLVFSDLYNSTVFFLFCFAFRRPLRARSVGRRPGTCCRCCARP